MSLRTGVIARSEARGLGIQTLDVARHLPADKVLLVEPTPNSHPTNRHWYDGLPVTIASWPTAHKVGQYRLDERTVRPWLEDLDVVYTAETAYDWRLPAWGRRAGCAVVVHANPELLPPIGRKTAGVTWWAPTPWLLDRLPPDTRVVPQPVDLPSAPPIPGRDGPLRLLHVAGHQAHLDRNGTRLLAAAVARLRSPCHLTVTGQDGRLPAFAGRDRRVSVTVHPFGFENRWDAYQADVLVMPRRYGGLCLAVQEAMACGMAVAMTDVSPNGVWPGPRFHSIRSRECGMLGGSIPVAEPDPAGVRSMIEWLAAKPDDVARHQADARAWAQANSWEALAPLWREELERAAKCRR